MVTTERITTLVTAITTLRATIITEARHTLRCRAEITLHAIRTEVSVKEIRAEQPPPAVL